MNYVSAVYGVIVFIMGMDWLLRGRKSYRGQTLRHEEVENAGPAGAAMRRGSVP